MRSGAWAAGCLIQLQGSQLCRLGRSRGTETTFLLTRCHTSRSVPQTAKAPQREQFGIQRQAVEIERRARQLLRQLKESRLPAHKRLEHVRKLTQNTSTHALQHQAPG